MRLSALQKDATFALAGAASTGVALYLSMLGVIPFVYTAGLAVATVMAPLWVALYLFKGKRAAFCALLAGFAMVCGLVFTVDAAASLQGFQGMCESRGEGHSFMRLADSYVCTAPIERDFIKGDIFSSSLSAVFLATYLGVVLLNIGYLCYLAARLAVKRRRPLP